MEILSLLLISLMALSCALYWAARASDAKRLRELLDQHERLAATVEAAKQALADASLPRKAGQLVEFTKR